MDTENESLLKELNKLIDKAEKTRAAHFLTASSLAIRGKVLHGSILIGSSIVAILTFADYRVFNPIASRLSQQTFTLFTGLLASLVFILSVLDEFIGWREDSRQHDSAGKVLTSFIRNANGIKQQKVITKEQVDIVRERYTLINEQTPSIPDRMFLKSKRQFLMKVSVSKELDNRPFESLRKIRRQLRKGERS